jgi:hypothetical protein
MARPPTPLLAVALAAVITAPVSAQTDASFGVGFGTVRYPGGTSIGIVSVSPMLQLIAPGRELWLGGNVSALPQGDWYGQARTAFWAATRPLGGRWRLAADFELGGATRGASTTSGAGQLAAEALWVMPRWGLGLGGGPASGWITGAEPVTAARTRLRGWWQDLSTRLSFSASIEPTRLLGAWFTDLGAGMDVRGGRLEAHVWASGRVSAVYGSKAAALASAELRLSPLVSLEASGGSVLPDPYQGFPRSTFVTAGVRFRLPNHAAEVVPAGGGPLTVTHRADGLVIRLRRRGPTTVSVAGDWNDWTPTPFARVDRDVWEVVLPLSRGTYHFTLLIDGAAWTIPAGVPSVPDGMGGRVAVLTVL